jgi:peptidoglycan/LPS O-acetylase OafA/YrhL
MANSAYLSDSKYRTDIQVFRGMAVLAVVLFHLNEKVFPLGYLGVDVFFTISGFVVTPLILRIFYGKETLTWKVLMSNLNYFYKRRFYRLAPALTTTLILSALLVFLAGPISDHQRFARQGIATTLLVGNLGAYRYTGDYFSPNPNPLIHTWSLSVEEQIYIFLPLTLMLIFNKRKVKRKTALLALALITLISFYLFFFPGVLFLIYNYLGIESGAKLTFYLPVARIWQFTLGGIGFLLLNHRQSTVVENAKISKLLLATSMILVLFGSFNIDNKISSILASFVSLFVIMFKSLDILPNLLSNMFEWLGDRSYSIYLIHMPLIYLLNYSPITNFETFNNFNQILIFAIIVLLGSLMFSKIEIKYRKMYLRTKKLYFKHLLVATIIPIVILLSIDRIASRASNYDPNLPTGSKVLPWAWDQSCKFLSNQNSILSEPCAYGNSKTGKSILLIGDSHAAAVSRAVIELGKNNDMKTFVSTFQGCGFVLNRDKFNPRYDYPFLNQSCLDHNLSIIDFISTNNPTVIILVQHSSSIMVEPNNSESRFQYNDMVLSSLLEIQGVKNNIILVGSGPEYIDQNSWVQKVFGVRKNIYSNIPFEDNVYWKNATLNVFYYLDTLKTFCPQNVCSNKSDKGWLFQDRDHLSELGASLLIPELDILVKKILD